MPLPDQPPPGIPQDPADEAVDAAQRLSLSLDRMAAELTAVREATRETDESSRKRDQETDESSRQRDQALRRASIRNLILIVLTGLLAAAVGVLGFLLNGTNGRAAAASAQAAAADANSAAVKAAQQAMHLAQIEGCETNNAKNARQLVFWDYLFSTAKQQTPQLARFEHLVKQAYAPRNCQKAYALPSAGTPAPGHAG